MDEKHTEIIMLKHREKRCIICGRMWRKKGSEYCYKCDPNKHLIKYTMPSFNKLTTIEGIRRAYGNLLNALRKQKIGRDEASAMFYGLNSFIKAMKDILEMKIITDDHRPLITDVKIEQMKALILKMETLHHKFTNSSVPVPTGEITQAIVVNDDTID